MIIKRRMVIHTRNLRTQETKQGDFKSGANLGYRGKICKIATENKSQTRLLLDKAPESRPSPCGLPK